MGSLVIPQDVTQNIARAKALFRRDEVLRGLDALILALNAYEPAKLMGRSRFEVEVLITECMQEVNRNPSVRKILEALTNSPKASIPYVPGGEAKLKALLPVVRKAIAETSNQKEQKEQEERELRKNTLRDKGIAYLKAKDLPRGKAALRRLADEFGDEPGIYVLVGAHLLEAGLFYDAAEFLELSMEKFPRESKAYAYATKCYIALREFGSAEGVYVKAIKTFGKHPVTLTNLAKLYLAWNKKDKAFEAAQAALGLDANNAEAKAIFEKLS